MGFERILPIDIIKHSYPHVGLKVLKFEPI
jgi:hypothetical protein